MIFFPRQYLQSNDVILERIENHLSSLMFDGIFEELSLNPKDEK